MEKIDPLKVAYAEALLEVERKGVTTTQLGAGTDYIRFQGAIPDIVAYL